MGRCKLGKASSSLPFQASYHRLLKDHISQFSHSCLLQAIANMLRMRPTAIELNYRDHDWHIMRHEHRQNQRTQGFPLETDSLKFPHPEHVQEDTSLQHRSPGSSSSEDSGIIAGPHIPQFSRRPDMHKFWSSVVAGAGVLPEVQSLYAAKPVSISGPSDHVVKTHSVKGSIEENRDVLDDQNWHHVIDLPKHHSQSQPSEQSQRHRRQWSPLTVSHYNDGSSRDDVSGVRQRDASLRDLDGSSDPSPSLEDLHSPSRVSDGTALALPSLNIHQRSPLYISHLAANSSPERFDFPNALARLSIDSRNEDLAHIHPATEIRTSPRYLSPYQPWLTIPAHPFSAVRRAISSTPALPSVSVSPSPGRNHAPSYSTSSGSLLSLATPPGTPNYYVYDQRLPAVLQPRTQAGLASNQLPIGGPSTGLRGAFTAPARATNQVRRQPSGTGYSAGSPRSRRSSIMAPRAVDQGGEQHIVEVAVVEEIRLRYATIRPVSQAFASEDSRLQGLLETQE